MEYVLRGNSGCVVKFVDDGHTRIVRKTSVDHETSRRLYEQVKRIERLRTCHRFDVPKIVTMSYGDDTCEFYDMEHITGSLLCAHISISPVAITVDTLKGLLVCVQELASVSQCEGHRVINIRESVLKKISAFPDAIVAKAPDVFKFIEEVDDVECPMTMYHGDLTFENVIVKRDGTLVLIDPINSYIDSFVVDLSKIATELWCRWSTLNHRSQIDLGSLSLLRDVFMDEKMVKMYRQVLPKLVVLDVMRAVPYAIKRDVNLVDRLFAVSREFIERW